MQMDILNKILLIVLVMSSLNVTRHLFYFAQAWMNSDSENPQKYRISNTSLWILSVSIAYVITSILTGINL